MSISLDEKDRLLLPRWLPFESAAKLGEVSSDSKTVIQKDVHFDEKKHDWNLYRDVVYAVDLVGTAIIVNEFDDIDAKQAASFIIDNTNNVSTLALEIARTFSGASPANPNLINSNSVNRMSVVHHKIASIRKLLNDYAKNPILWTDLAYYYAVMGLVDKAEKCTNVAISLSPNNRFVLRSATRCYLHSKNGDKALFYLNKSPATINDPWLLATEISLSEALHKKTVFIKPAKTLLDSHNFSNKACSELAGALGTLELSHGSLRLARKLFHRALVDPTENTIAQTEWMHRSLGIFYEFSLEKIPGVFEACARILYREKNYKQSLVFSQQWMDFQPFSSRAASFSSYIASVCLNDHQTALRLIETAKLSAPNDSTLENNHAFALASLGRIDDAINIINKIKIADLDVMRKSILTATLGLIMYKTGNPGKGNEFYATAVKYFHNRKRDDLASIASLYWGIEESAINKEKGVKILNEAITLAKASDMVEIKESATRSINAKGHVDGSLTLSSEELITEHKPFSATHLLLDEK